MNKTYINLYLALILAITTSAAFGQNSELQQKLIQAGGSGSDTASEIIKVLEGEYIEIYAAIGNNDSSSRCNVSLKYNGKSISLPRSRGGVIGSTDGTAVQRYKGPCEIKIWGQNGGAMLLVYKILKVQDSNTDSDNVLVLPEGEDGKQKLVLESSTDLVNWTEDELGSKDSSDKKRFYRLRAVKE